MIANYKIQDINFSTTLDPDIAGFNVQSVPRPYFVDFVTSDNFKWIERAIEGESHALVLVDRTVRETLLNHINIPDDICFTVEAVEQNKNIEKVLEVCDWLLTKRANRGSMLFVIGGGIVQDIGAFAGAMFKRGIPWTYIPTTLLSQADSCLGGKTAVNHGTSKNVLGLFSAPRKVVIDSEFIKTLSESDRLSGAGEIFRLLVTAGSVGVQYMNQYIDGFLYNSRSATRNLTVGSLCVKQSIVEHDEFELDIRRSMNYGHSIGHALEALTEYQVPHGVGVAIGILVENQIAVNRLMLPKNQADTIFKLGKKIIPGVHWATFSKIDASKLLPYLTNDKKAVGNNLKLATLQSLGDMRFVDLPLNDTGTQEIVDAIEMLLAK